MDPHTPETPDVLELLAAEPNPAVDAALLEALPTLEDDPARRVLHMLLDRDHLATLASLVGRFPALSPALQAEMVSHVGRLYGAIRTATGSTRVDERVGGMALIARSDEGQLAWLLADAVRGRCARSRELAANALHGMTDRWRRAVATCASSATLVSLQEQARHLAEALERAVTGWNLHFQPRVLEAALWMSDRLETALRQKVEEPRSRLVRPIEELLAGSSDPARVGFLLRALTFPQLRTTAARAIGQARDDAFARALARESWLLADPAIAHGARWIRECRWLQNDGRVTSPPAAIASQCTDQAAGADLPAEPAASAVDTDAPWVRLVTLSGMPNERKLEIYRRVLAEGTDEARRAVLWALVDDARPAATEGLTLLAARQDDPLAPAAGREIRRRRGLPVRSPLVFPDGNRGGPGVATTTSARDSTAARKAERPAGTNARGSPATSPAAPGTAAQRWTAWFQHYLSEYERLTEDRRQALIAAMRPAARAHLAPLRTALASGHALDRARTLKLIQIFEIVPLLAEEIQRLAHDADPLIRGTAMSTLQHLPGPVSLRLLRQGVEDADPRVQANAIESLDVLDAPDREKYLSGKLDSPHSRVRANAAQSLMRVELHQAGDALLDMLEDQSRAHRLSALWVVERLALRSVIHRITDIARHDPDPAVRQRAARVLRTLVLGDESPAAVSAAAEPEERES